MIAASIDASMAASPRVAPTVRCSMTSIETGKRSARDEDREIFGLFLGELSGDAGAASCSRTQLRLNRRRGDDVLVEHDGDALAARGVAQAASTRVPPIGCT